MKPRYLLMLFCSAIILAACVPAVGVTPTSFPTVSVSTASFSTVVPVIITPFPPDYTRPPTTVPPSQTPIPTLANGLNPSELKYRLLDEFPNFFFCDPDYYPIAREDETSLALQHFAEIQANSDEFNAILAHSDIPVSPSYSDDQKLLIYREHKKLAAIHFELSGNLYTFQISISDTKQSGEAISGTIDGQGKIDVQQRTPAIATCPICLALGTRIDTPSGSIAVQDLRPGMLVWTLDLNGRRVAEPVLTVGKTVVASTHKVVHIVLDDGREVWVSPGHPTADGRPVGLLQVGESLDGGTIRSAALVSYTGYATYDLLPVGDTGTYWANGILLGSTLNSLSK